MKNLVDKIREYNVLMGKYEKKFLMEKKISTQVLPKVILKINIY